ncbi:hypothetical protein ERJ75_000762400 [Trypanosoma vivax]|uniref:Uncharacterized protein n=1 Tax=Trypanosoma vivax (strain Y486) TaxID=1055687 RepID=G0TV90_TRYVY|nr:hypothetical protein TRVL_02625 [Trypanosoma vivax]KAH8614296.1 hypothetical protein ERJ75_000762400 [Trypanosoma vivax]CCC47856.1 conserved hypothetical protein [Trypanosoma vivax Y486]
MDSACEFPSHRVHSPLEYRCTSSPQLSLISTGLLLHSNCSRSSSSDGLDRNCMKEGGLVDDTPLNDGSRSAHCMQDECTSQKSARRRSFISRVKQLFAPSKRSILTMDVTANEPFADSDTWSGMHADNTTSGGKMGSDKRLKRVLERSDNNTNDEQNDSTCPGKQVCERQVVVKQYEGRLKRSLASSLSTEEGKARKQLREECFIVMQDIGRTYAAMSRCVLIEAGHHREKK